MIAAYRFDRLLSELNDIQRNMSWGMTCKGQLFEDVYCEWMTIDCDPLRSIDEMLNSKYASCLEYAIIMKHSSDRLGIQSKQCVIPRDVPWAMHGVLFVDNHVISMGNSVKVYEVSREYGELVCVDINQGNTRKYVHGMMQNRMRSRSGMLV